jgi:hypothetical protein
MFKKVLASDLTEIEYTHFSLRSGKDIFVKGGSVVQKYKDQKIRLLYANRREIIEQNVVSTTDGKMRG